ncbi:MAG: membrane or secreted protein [Planctomycetota bacterium]
MRLYLLLFVSVFQYASVSAQQADTDEYINGVSLLPASTAGVVRIPEVPAFCDAWEKTQIGQLMKSDAMQPFLGAQRDRASNYFDTLDRKIGVKPQDVYNMASGEVVIAWMAFPDDKRRPYALSIIADIRGRKPRADAAAKQLDNELKQGGATRRDITYGDEVIRVYQTKAKPGQLKIEEIAITWNETRFIAADRDTVIQSLLDAASGKAPLDRFASRNNFKKVQADSMAAVQAAAEKDATVCWEWFAEPFAMGRILREVFEYDRRDDLDILQLLERQGFQVVEAVGGVGVVAGERLDILHRGVVIAPGRLTKAARMLQAFNAPMQPIPGWVSEDTGTFYRLSWKLEEAFWAAESLVNDALGEDLFRPMIDGIRDDKEGPQIDLAKDFLPNLDDEIILLTDNVMPPSPESDRMLAALRVKNAEVVQKVVRKAMESEGDAVEIEVEEFDAWRVEYGEGDQDDLDAELAQLGFEEDIETEDQGRLITHFAIAVVDGKTPDDPSYLIFSTHSDLLVKLGQRIRAGAQDGFADEASTKQVTEVLQQLGAKQVSVDGIMHPAISLRARYELLRRGELKERDTILANLLRRLVEEDEDGEPDPIQAAKLPPFQQIQTYLKSAGSFWEKTPNGWAMTFFMLAK